MRMVYYALINLSGGEQSPYNTNEYLFLAISMVISAMFFTNIFSSILSVYGNLIFEQAFKQADLDDMNETMNCLTLTESVKDEVRQYYKKQEPSRDF